ncbi:PEP-CTERM sorting domain-containing protein [Thalassotalea profundi]|uniref:Ice-binding protein C-terminal domain-containing protein n=1 Tax=Thalassotalea profundi TaxID=2036687 RepID=A0ABQ3IMQ9_9GAMM|nr:PEP-CTERM sorting domain-containing protein [Thalassotalea profundi]GHE87298.1 hypothetical protein GCM10011501_15900 [Thalassotalea profundi]
MKAIIRNAVIGLSCLFSMSASAGLILDVQEYSNNTATEYFVDVDSNKTNNPYYRNSSQDWEWVHDGIAGSSFTSILLDISAFDVDAPAENDEISVFDGVNWVSLGALAGNNNVWAFTQFDLTGFAWAEAQVNAGLKVRVDIDTLNGNWLVTLGKAVLTVDDGTGNGGGGACVPTPGIPCTTTVPEPSSLMILGLGLLGFQARRKFLK